MLMQRRCHPTRFALVEANDFGHIFALKFAMRQDVGKDTR